MLAPPQSVKIVTKQNHVHYGPGILGPSPPERTTVPIIQLDITLIPIRK